MKSIYKDILSSVTNKIIDTTVYRSGTLNSNMVNSKYHLIRSFFEIFARFLSPDV